MIGPHALLRVFELHILLKVKHYIFVAIIYNIELDFYSYL